MSSNVDPTVPPDNVQVDKATLRANFRAAWQEITDLQRVNTTAYRVMRGTEKMLEN